MTWISDSSKGGKAMTKAHSSFFEDMAWDSLCCYKEENLVKLESQLNGKLKETQNS